MPALPLGSLQPQQAHLYFCGGAAFLQAVHQPWPAGVALGGEVERVSCVKRGGAWVSTMARARNPLTGCNGAGSYSCASCSRAPLLAVPRPGIAGRHGQTHRARSRCGHTGAVSTGTAHHVQPPPLPVCCSRQTSHPCWRCPWRPGALCGRGRGDGGRAAQLLKPELFGRPTQPRVCGKCTHSHRHGQSCPRCLTRSI